MQGKGRNDRGYPLETRVIDGFDSDLLLFGPKKVFLHFTCVYLLYSWSANSTDPASFFFFFFFFFWFLVGNPGPISCTFLGKDPG